MVLTGSKTKILSVFFIALFLTLLAYGVFSGDPGFIRLEGGTL
jgi:hypothetical protein